MSKRWFGMVGAVCALALGTAGFAQGITLEFDPVSQTVAKGATVDVGVVISGLGDFSSPSLSTFDLDISFDPSVLSFSSVMFGDPGLGDQLDLFGLGSATSVNPSTGSVNIFQLSLDLPSDLDSLQAGSFTLFTITFDALAAGTSSLGITINALGDSFAVPLTADVVGGAATVAPGSAPEPATLALLGLGLSGMWYGRRRRVEA